MNSYPKISIITVCFNSEKTIEQTIQSVLDQTYKSTEYIIIDGASTDNTIEILNKYQDSIDQLISEPDKGVYDAFNKGVSIAQGDYILFLNSDDYFVNEHIVQQLADYLIEKNYPVGIYGDIYIKNEQTGYIDRFGKKFDLRKIKDGSMPPHPATLLSKKVIVEFGGFDLNYQIAADFDLITKIFLKYEDDIFYISMLVSVFRLGGLSSNKGTLPIVKKETKSIIDKYFPNYDSAFDEYVKMTNEEYLKAWLEHIVFNNRSISDPLKQSQINSVVIFGSGEMALLVAHDFMKNGIHVLGYLDNNIERQEIFMNDVCVYSPDWLKENEKLVDAVIYGFQGFHEEVVEQQLNSYELKSDIKRVSWRQLVSEIS